MVILGVPFANISFGLLANCFFRTRKAISSVTKKYWLGQAIQDSAFAAVLSGVCNTATSTALAVSRCSGHNTKYCSRWSHPSYPSRGFKMCFRSFSANAMEMSPLWGWLIFHWATKVSLLCGLARIKLLCYGDAAPLGLSFFVEQEYSYINKTD